jgi:hypothetical protein
MGLFDTNYNTYNSAMNGYNKAGSGGGYNYKLDWIPDPQSPDFTKANTAAFGRAKDQVGRQSRAAVSSLRDELGASGMGGSGAEAAGIRDVVRAGQGELGEVRRDQAMSEAQRAADFAKLAYEGALQQRGQDISIRGEDVTQRGQDVGALSSQYMAQFSSQNSQMQQLMALLAMIMGGLK